MEGKCVRCVHAPQVERPLVAQKLDAAELTINKGLDELTWRSAGERLTRARR